ncbi:MAG: hypothetical protein JF627_04710 [Alphaproteobacteria bacterium]|nr:hypothetical protein [Alphaproteobacteria bacterium]
MPETRRIAEHRDVPLDGILALKAMDYVHPDEVVEDDRLDPAEKRTILSAWASDACAVDSRPGFRWLSGTPGPILVDHVLSALRTLDAKTGWQNPRQDASLPRPAADLRHSHLFARRAGRGMAGLGN